MKKLILVRGLTLALPMLPLLAALPAQGWGAQPVTLKNERYSMTVEADGALSVAAPDAAPQRFEPVFTILAAHDDPKIALRPGDIPNTSYNVTTWKVAPDLTAAPAAALKGAQPNTAVEAGDGFDVRIQKGDRSKRTANLFAAARNETAAHPVVTVKGNAAHWEFPANDAYSLRASVELAEGGAPPRLTYEFIPKKPGWYSVGYTGAPSAPPADIDELWQPLVWTEKRFPEHSFLTMAFHCPLPGTLVSRAGVTSGLVADSAELPFQPLPTFDNSRFGVAVRNAEGQAQPMIFAPALGAPGSSMRADEPFRFAMHLVVRAGSCAQAFEDIARNLFAFRDYRRNATASLNQTLENEIDYGLSEYSRFNHDLRGCSYETDVAGSVKNVSALHPLAMAMVTDDARIYRERARPIMEFLLSREKFLFVSDPKVKTQNPGHLMTGPCAPGSELANLYLLGQKRTPLLLEKAVAASRKGANIRWEDALPLYRATGDQAYLQRAVAGADAYIESRMARPDTGFGPGKPFFWTSHAPDFIKLYELFEATGEKRFLEAAHTGARRFVEYIWYCPEIPDGDVTVNEGGQAPVYWYLKRHGTGPMKVPEETVPAWRLSEIGLTCEASGTSAGHRGIFMACYAPWLMRIAMHSGDRFLHDTARAAVVGRYANFPGYHMNTARTTVYEKPGYPLRDYKELTYNSFHYNHIWPHMVMLFDYLVADAAYRSKGQIDFGSRFSEAYAYLQNKLYGDQPGHIYDEKDLWIWMPRGLVSVDNVQINYLAARGGDSIYLVLTNQSFEPVKAAVQLNGKLVDLANAKSARVWQQNEPATPLAVSEGRVEATVAAEGITVLAFDGVRAVPKFQTQVLAEGEPLAPASHAELDYGGTKAMLLSMGAGMTHAYVYLQATAGTLKRAVLHYRTGEEWKRVGDDKYPFEFTLELQPNERRFEFYVEGEGVTGETGYSAKALLER